MSSTPLSKMNKKQLYEECKDVKEENDEKEKEIKFLKGQIEKYNNLNIENCEVLEERIDKLEEEKEELKKDVKLLQAQKNYYQVNLRAINYISSDAGNPIAPIIFDGFGPPETHEDLEGNYSYKPIKEIQES